MDQKNLNEELLNAAVDGDTKSVEECLARGANVNYKDRFGYSPLFVASQYGHTETVSRLVDLGADIEAKNKSGQSPLFVASEYGHTETVSRLVDRGADIDAKDIRLGWSPLFVASRYGRTETVSRLVDLGADIEAKDNKGRTPYDVAKNDEINELLKIHVQQIEQEKKIQNAKTFKILLSDGTYESFGNRIYLAGACNVGKSTLASLLIGDEIPLQWKSTDGLRIFFGRNGIDVKKRIMVPLKKGKGESDVLTNVLRGHPVMKQDKPEEEASPSTSAHAMSASADVETSRPGPSSSGRSFQKDYNKAKQTKKHKQVVTPSRLEFSAVHEKIKTALKKGDYKVDIAPSDLVDFGGQRSYDMTHQLFIQGKGTFTLIFDGRKRLCDPLAEYKGTVTTESILKHWVDSILTYCGVDDGDVLPVILFVATHRDSFKNEDEQYNRRKEFKEGLSKLFENHERHHRIEYHDIFFINGRDPNDPEVKRLKAKYVDIAYKQKSWGQRKPMAWVPLELQMSEMRSKNITIIPKDELEELNRNNDDLALDNQQLDQFLKRQHSLGKIMYFEGQGLEKYIIVQPTSLVDILRSFITDKKFFPFFGRKILTKMTKTGKIKKKNLFKLWSKKKFNQLMPTDEIKEFVAQVLVHLDILVEPKPKTEQTGTSKFYLVPCAVTCEPSTDFFEGLGNDKALYMSYRLLKSSIPSALSFKLIGAILNVWPLKETDEGICLYHKAAILDINEDNELSIWGKDDRIVVCLFNKTTKGFISPDIASCAQECLTLAMTTALEFYHNTFGKCISNSEISNLLQIEVGWNCETDICYISLADAKLQLSWKCSRGQEHSTEKLLHWSYDKGQERCIDRCTGLDAALQCPKDQHLARLAVFIDTDKLWDLVTYLGLPDHEWKNIEYEHRLSDPRVLKFAALIRWKTYYESKGRRPTYTVLQKAISDTQQDVHLLCKIIREDRKLLEIENTALQQVPGDDVLLELSGQIGICALQLGVELGLDIMKIEATLKTYNKDFVAQNNDILTKWKNSNKNTTLRRLMQALQIIGARGLTYLDDKYKIGLFDIK